MSASLACDAPDCVRTIPAMVVSNRIVAPEGWWLLTTGDGKLIAACCSDHLNRAIQATPK